MLKRIATAALVLLALASPPPRGLHAVPETTLETNTFSIVVADPRSREVAVAGASCVRDVSIIGSLIQNVGAAATQASFAPANKSRVEQRLRAGDTPQGVISFVTNPSRDANFRRRQYGVVTLANGAAGFTGSRTSSANGHRQAPFVSVQGNLLERESVLDSILGAWRGGPERPTVERLLLALEAGQAAGGDARCRHGADSAFIRIRRAEDAGASYADLVVTNRASGENPDDPIAELRRAVQAWGRARAGRVDRWTSRAALSPARIPADGGAAATLTVTVRDPSGRGLTGRSLTASGAGIGSLSAFEEQGGGVYTATVRSTRAGAESFALAADGMALGDRPRVEYVEGLERDGGVR